jgi:6-phosphogluconolactonase
MPTLAFHCFTQLSELDTELAKQVARQLQTRLNAPGKASLVLSGGRTPTGFLQALSHHVLDWGRVIVTLADERCVDEHSPHSNAASIRDHLLQNQATQAVFLPLYLPGESLQNCQQRLSVLPQYFDVVVLGMGEDGHTASIFPDSPNREAALHDASGRSVLAVQGKAPVNARLTLTGPRLLATRQLILHITGYAKWQVLGRALATPTPALPISHFLHATEVEKHVFWAR